VIDLQAPVQFVKSIGPQRAAALERVGIERVQDLLFHLPMRYEDRSSFVKIAALEPRTRATVIGTIVLAGLRRARRLTLFEAVIEDETGRFKVVWFNQPYLKDTLTTGRKVMLYGAVEQNAYGHGQPTMSSPHVEVVEGEEASRLHAGRVVPIYEKLGPLTGNVLRRVLTQLSEQLPDDLPDSLPEDARFALGVMPLGPALRDVHVPPQGTEVSLLNAARSPAHLRLILEEFFLFELGLAARRENLRGERKRLAFEIGDAVREAVKRVLPFRLTEAQRRVLREIGDDLRSSRPMNRLLQGDVGSGKTMVALLAMIVALENGHQAAFMAPTEILAEQHFLNFKRWLASTPYTVELLSAGVKGRERREALERLESGDAQLVVGTHALVQRGVRFHRLGLAVVDEQHRFGVLQRDELRRKGYDADVLVMTATPIPRTLALTAYGDLDVSVIDERPPGRTPVRTLVRLAMQRREIVELVRRELEARRQAYVVYPLVAESEKLEDVRGATEMAEEWRRALPGFEVGLLHGRLKAQEKEEVMAAFVAGNLHILVATTVIEVGVDVPNATVMIVEHAERFGLAQLHQLRGRVGRGQGASTCVLVGHGKLSDEAHERLNVLARSDDGFVIAEKDLELRGPGDFFGTRQSGMPRLRLAQLVRDAKLLEQARTVAFNYVATAATEGRKHSLTSFLESGAWETRFGLSRVG
jgi:ATP-dependent DNA helicase RecG